MAEVYLAIVLQHNGKSSVGKRHYFDVGVEGEQGANKYVVESNKVFESWNFVLRYELVKQWPIGERKQYLRESNKVDNLVLKLNAEEISEKDLPESL